MRKWMLLWLLLTGCASTPPLNTPSQRPEVTIAGATKAQIFEALAGEMAANGAQVKTTTPYSITFSKPETSFTGALLYGSRYDPTPLMVITYTAVDAPGGQRVFCTAAMVRNPGSGFEHSTDITAGAGPMIQGMLERLKTRLAK